MTTQEKPASRAEPKSVPALSATELEIQAGKKAVAAAEAALKAEQDAGAKARHAYAEQK